MAQHHLILADILPTKSLQSPKHQRPLKCARNPRRLRRKRLHFFLIDPFDCFFFLLTDCFLFLCLKSCDNTPEHSCRRGEAFHLALAVRGAFINMYNEVVARSLLLLVPHKRSSGGGGVGGGESKSDKVIIVAHLSIKNVIFFCVASKLFFLFLRQRQTEGRC